MQQFVGHIVAIAFSWGNNVKDVVMQTVNHSGRIGSLHTFVLCMIVAATRCNCNIVDFVISFPVIH